MNQKRKQLTLFVDPSIAEIFEQIRRKFNPLQYALIKAHITLCREDELLDEAQLLQNLIALEEYQSLTLKLGPPVRFAAGKGLFIPIIDVTKSFHQLRCRILSDLVQTTRNHDPHLTLIHPRNGHCTDDIFHLVEAVQFPQFLTFDRVSLIEQEIGKKWKTLQVFPLANHC